MATRNPFALYHSILIIKRGALGDLLAGTAGILAVRKQFPKAHICLLSDSLAERVCPVGTIVDEIINEKEFIKKNKLGYWKLLRTIRKRNFDLIINMRWFSEISAILTLLGNGKSTAGAGSMWLRKLFNFSPPKTKDEGNLHEYLLNLRIVQSIGLPEQQPELFLHIADEDLAWANKYFLENNLSKQNLLLITPIASTPLKAWPPERFVEIAQRFIAEFKGQVLITYSPNDKYDAKEVADSIGHGAILAPETTINQLAALVARVKLCLCNNSGIMHVAFAVGTPVVCINTSIGWAPYGDWNVAVTQLPDQLNHDDNRRLSNERVSELLKKISVEQVWKALALKWNELPLKS